MTKSEWKFKFVRKIPPPVSEGAQATAWKMFRAFRQALLDRRGDWALYPGSVNTEKSAYDIAYQINSGRRPTFPKETFEARSAGCVVYVRAKPIKE